MVMESKICVLIPSYNEAKTIGCMVKQLRRRQMIVYVVDDGSTDGTAEKARAEGAIVVVHHKNMGKGASLIEGFKHVLKKDFDAVMVMDGDGQHSIDDIDNFLKKYKETGADIILGNRMLNTASMPYVRLHTNRFMSWLLSRIAGQDMPDTQCGFRLIKKAVLQKVKLESRRYDAESELIIKASRLGFKIESVAVRTVYQGEVSRINPVFDTLRFMVLLAKIMFRRQ